MMAVSPSRKSSPRGDEVFEQVVLLAVGVQRAGQRGAEAGEVRAAVGRVDVVDVGVDVFGVLGRVLQGDFDADAVLLAGDVDDVGVERFAGAVEVLDEFHDAAFVLERFAFAGALVVEDDLHALVEERQFLQAACGACCSRTSCSPKIWESGLKVVLVPRLVGVADAADLGLSACRARIPADRRGRRGGLRPRTTRRGS